MRRALPVIASTAGGLALLANFHTSRSSATVTTGPASAQQPLPSAEAPPATQGPAAPSTNNTTSTTAAPTATRTVDGPVAATDYGDVQVRVVLQGSKIIDVRALQLPSDRSRSARISQEAAPLLREEALKAQSANIDLLSGATYTSDGYIRSLQGALDRAGR